MPNVLRDQHLRTARPRAQLRAGRTDWYRVKNLTSGTVAIYIYDEIGYWGVTPQDFVTELNTITSATVELHINSPGGSAFDGITIMNALADHPATVNVVVDGMAASAASIIAMAGDTITMNPGSRLIIHEAWAICIGPATDMRALADELDAMGNDLAALYATKAGGTADEWRAAMQANGGDGTSYNGDEAVAAGLADRVGRAQQADDADEVDMSASWDLSIFARTERTAAQPAAVAEQQPVEPEIDVGSDEDWARILTKL